MFSWHHGAIDALRLEIVKLKLEIVQLQNELTDLKRDRDRAISAAYSAGFDDSRSQYSFGESMP
jgi:hypothetical protein